MRQSVASHHPTDPPRGEAIRELFGWRILACQDARHSWVEVEPGSLAPAPGEAKLIAEALRSVATYAGDCAVKAFVEAQS